MKKVVHFEVHFVILYSKTELLSERPTAFFSETKYFNLLLSATINLAIFAILVPIIVERLVD